jgi:hypothetical protein
MLSVGVVLLLALGCFTSQAFGQSGDPGRQARPGGLRQNFPNPFNPETNIPFDLPDGLFENGNRVRITIRVFNVLRQQVAIPTARDHPAGGAPPVQNLEYTQPGNYIAYWDGLDRDGRKVASGIYIVLLEVNGRRYGSMKMTVAN